MSERTARLGLPYIISGQAQKDITHNEALALLDACLMASVEGLGSNAPPASPDVGQCWIVGDAPTGEWADSAQALAVWTEGGWRFVAATEGMRVWLKPSQLCTTYRSSGWTVGEERVSALLVDGVAVVGSRKASVPAPSGGSIIDLEARAAISQIVSRLAAHGLIEATP